MPPRAVRSSSPARSATSGPGSMPRLGSDSTLGTAPQIAACRTSGIDHGEDNDPLWEKPSVQRARESPSTGGVRGSQRHRAQSQPPVDVPCPPVSGCTVTVREGTVTVTRCSAVVVDWLPVPAVSGGSVLLEPPSRPSGKNNVQIARALGRHRSTVWRELRATYGRRRHRDQALCNATSIANSAVAITTTSAATAHSLSPLVGSPVRSSG